MEARKQVNTYALPRDLTRAGASRNRLAPARAQLRLVDSDGRQGEGEHEIHGR